MHFIPSDFVLNLHFYGRSICKLHLEKPEVYFVGPICSGDLVFYYSSIKLLTPLISTKNHALILVTITFPLYFYATILQLQKNNQSLASTDLYVYPLLPMHIWKWMMQSHNLLSNAFVVLHVDHNVWLTNNKEDPFHSHTLLIASFNYKEQQQPQETYHTLIYVHNFILDHHIYLRSAFFIPRNHTKWSHIYIWFMLFYVVMCVEWSRVINGFVWTNS